MVIERMSLGAKSNKYSKQDLYICMSEVCAMLEYNSVNDLLVPIMFAHAIVEDTNRDRNLTVHISDIEDLIVAIDKVFDIYGDNYVSRKTAKMLAKAQRFSTEIEEMLVAEEFKPFGVSTERIRSALLACDKYIELRDKTLEAYIRLNY